MDEAVIKSILERIDDLIAGNSQPQNRAEQYFMSAYRPALLGERLLDLISELDPELHDIDFYYFITGYCYGQNQFYDRQDETKPTPSGGKTFH
jgi:hypothetical protein